MPPSSLIFVVILAVWAAYLIQHWVRRRDHIATARSVDRFSEAMRVLERRQRGPRIDLSTPAPRSYAVSPARPAHPEVTVKRARAALPRETPVSVSLRSSPAQAVTAPLSGARGRGTTLLLASLAMVLGTALGVLEIWPLWTVVAGIGVFVLTLAVVRTSVRRSTSTSTSTHDLPKPLPRATPVGRPAGPDDRTPVPPTRPAPPKSPSAVYDVDAVEARHRFAAGGSGVAQQESAGVAQQKQERAQEIPGTWQPVPVPRPTYTLKARASAPHTGSSAMATTWSTAAQDLPFDGYALAFEEESEELPAVHSLG